jgi:hypothetical protein
MTESTPRGSRIACPAAGLLVVLAASAGACVTETVTSGTSLLGGSSTPVVADSVVVPLGPGDPERSAQIDAQTAFYSSILDQMNDAVGARDGELLDDLLLRHDHDRAPDWARDKFDRFRELGASFAFLEHLERGAAFAPATEEAVWIEWSSADGSRARPRFGTGPSESDGGGLRLVGGVLADPEASRPESRARGSWRIDRLGESIPLRWSLAPAAHAPVRVRGGTAFRFTFRATDHDATGGRAERVMHEVVRLRRTHRFEAGREPLELQVELPSPPLRGVRREVQIVVEMMPCTLRVDGVKVPVARPTPCGTMFVQLYPDGTQVVREQPLKTLRRAIARGDAAHFPHVALAVYYLPAADHAAAIDELVAMLRVGNAAQGRVATAGLSALTGVGISLDDREAWLRWYAEQHAAASEEDRRDSGR